MSVLRAQQKLDVFICIDRTRLLTGTVGFMKVQSFIHYSKAVADDPSTSFSCL